MLNLSWNNFDKGFWVSSTNMRNLINAAINININVGAVERNIDYIYSEITSILDSIQTGGEVDEELKSYIDSIAELLEKHIEYQRAVNESFQKMFGDVTDILLNHEERLQALERGG